MVYEGRPSRGCQTCKTRRIKCDENRPACLNCIKSHRTCPGPPDAVDLMFRAEHPGSRRRAKKEERKDSGNVNVVELQGLVDEYEREQRRLENHRTTPKSHPERCRGPSVEADRPGQAVCKSDSSKRIDLGTQMRFNPTIEQQATTYFFANFVLNARSKEVTRGFLGVAASLFQAAPDGSSLHLAVRAVAVSVIANWPGRRDLAERAQRIYLHALNSTQQDLRDPSGKRGTSDSTLLSVLLFSMYESITSSETSVQAWGKHIEGAVTIVRARGKGQFRDPRSLLLFRAVRSQMLSNAIQQRKRIPEFPGGWTSDVESDGSATQDLIRFSVQLPNLLAKAKSLFSQRQAPDTTVEMNKLLEEVLAAQQALMSWEYQIPPEWGCTTVTNTSDQDFDLDRIEERETWPGVLHLYKDVHIAAIRNNNRVSQMLCSSTIIDSLKWLSPRGFSTDERYSKAKHRLQSLVDDICYSVPFHLYGPEVANKARVNSGEAVGGYFLIWPLYAASIMQNISEIQRRWLRGRLCNIARVYGLNQGNDMGQSNTGRPGAGSNETCEVQTSAASEPRIRMSRAELICQSLR